MRLAAALAVLLLPAAARAVELSAEVNKATVVLGDQLVLAVTVSGAAASLPKPRLPSFEDFEAYESGTSQNFSFINGRMSSRVVHTFVLSPRKAGKARVPPVTVEADGKTLATEPIEVTVLPAGAASSAARAYTTPAPTPRAAPRAAAPESGARPDVFLSASLDKATAYAGEQVTLTVRFHTAVPLLGSAQYDAPKLEGFLTEDLGQSQTSADVGGRSYHVTEVKTALFPVHGGRLSVGAATARTSVARGGGSVGGDLFEQFFSMTAPQPVTVRSEPVTLEASPVPEEGRPEGFNGAVGRFRVKASVDRARLKVGEAATLTVEVSGTGNLRSVGEPSRPDTPALRFFDTESTVSVTKADGVVGGTKVLKTVFVPRASGVVELPPLVLWHFDPARRAFVKAESAPLSLTVEAGAPGAGAADGGPSAPALGVVTRDVRYLKAGPVRGAASRALEAFAGLGALHALPLLVLLGAAG
ncbi:MAG: BatD family protein, partial [Elusimicrobiota bacterium]|nr:BatD family protein [Elusimicrobiota bacterium]